MPVFATDMLHGDAYTLGRLMVASGVGAILGALCLASRDSVRGFGRVLVLSTGLFGLGLVELSYAQYEVVAWLALVLARYLPVLRALIRPNAATRGLRQDPTGQTQTAIDAYLYTHH